MQARKLSQQRGLAQACLLGVIRMSVRNSAIAATVLTLAALASIGLSTGLTRAADLPTKAAKKPADLPFFLLIDDRVTYSWMPKGTDPGVFSVRPNGSIDGTNAKQV
jgi:hypothetical protein